MHRSTVLLIVLLIIAGLGAATPIGRNLIWAGFVQIRGTYTVDKRLEQYGASAREQLAPHFKKAQVHYPPRVVGLLAIKNKRRLEVYAGNDEKDLRFIKTYPILGQSGTLGPKLKEGDEQVPEGRYEIESMNPNSRFHLALRLNYPNNFDKARGLEEGRTALGSDIMIHGNRVSIGCLAMGDPAIEELFVLVADTGYSNTFAIITPVDFRVEKHWVAPSHLPKWVTELYRQLRIELRALPTHKGT